MSPRHTSQWSTPTLHVVDPRPKYPFQITAKRYRPHTSHPDGLTLILTHGTGYHKEHWEPSLERIFELAESNNYPIREAWSIDAPNHGDAAVLNEEALLYGYSHVFDWGEYGRSIHLFLTLYDSGTYFPSKNLLGIGHSMGAVALIISTTFLPPLTFKALIFCEPMLYNAEYAKDVDNFSAGAVGRRDIWSSKEEALEWIKKRKAFQIWDPRVLEIYIEHGLRPLPTAHYPDKKEGVTLKCFKLQEAACYREESAKARSFYYLGDLCASVPVHLIFGEMNDYLPRSVQDTVVDAAKGHLKSVQRVPGSGHLVVQRAPTALAESIINAISSIVSSNLTAGVGAVNRSKL